MMSVEYGDHQEFVDLAAKARLNLEATFSALDAVIGKASTNAPPNTIAALQSAGRDIKGLAFELLEKVEGVGQAIDRCDIFEVVDSLVEVAFEIGATASETRALADAKSQLATHDLAEARKSLATAGGKESGKVRTRESDKWKAALLDVAKSLSGRSIEALTERAMAALPSDAPKPPSHGAAYEYLRMEKNAGHISLRK